MDAREVAALITLLDDSDPEVFEQVSSRLLSLGRPVIPALEGAWEASKDQDLQKRLEEVIHQIQLEEIIQDFGKLMESNDPDLLEALVQINRMAFPGKDRQDLLNRLEMIRKSIWIEMKDSGSPIEQVNIFNQVFFRLLAFNITDQEMTNTTSYFLGYMLESRKGNPLSVTMVYLALARSLELPLAGVDLPLHFCLAWLKHLPEREDDYAGTSAQVLFYVNAAAQGTIFSRNEIATYLKKLKKDPQPEFFTPVSNRRVIHILLQALRNAYIATHQVEKAGDIEKLLALAVK